MIERRTENKIVLIVRRTRIDDLIARFNTKDQARFYIEHLGADVSDYQTEDRTYKSAVRGAENILSRHGRVQIVDRAFVPNFIFGPTDTVVAQKQLFAWRRREGTWSRNIFQKRGNGLRISQWE